MTPFTYLERLTDDELEVRAQHLVDRWDTLSSSEKIDSINMDILWNLLAVRDALRARGRARN